MKKLRPYFVPLVTLLTDLVTLGWRVIRQIILPTLARKGNLLSSLFVLFTCVVEQVISFGEAVARVPGTFQLPARFENVRAFSRRYLRQGMLIAAWALFILSSLEWTGTRPAVTEQTAAHQAAPEQTAVEQPAVGQTAGLTPESCRCQMAGPFKGNAQDIGIDARIAVPLSVSLPPCSTPRRLLLCTLRI